MNFFLNSCFILTTMASAMAYEQYIGNAKHPDYPGKCYYRETGRPIGVNEVYRPVNTGECHKITCRDDFVLRIDSCPRFQVGDDCRVIAGDLSQPFPRCCALLECYDRNGKKEIRPTHNEFGYENEVRF